MALIDHFPDRNPENVGLNELAQIVQSLPGFNDEPGLETEQILLDIQTVWYEEATSL